MGIREREERLFTQWRLKRRSFVEDGVADEATYLASKPRLLFVLKEVNDLEGGDWDLREFIREGGRAQTWNTVTRWIEGIRNLPNEMRWSELQDIDEQRRQRALISVAALNLKKSPGGHTSDAALLADVASEDMGFLNEQFGFYDPDIVVCCGVSDIFHSIIDFRTQTKWRVTSRGVWFHEFRSRKFVIAFAHPLARCAPNLLYYGLVDAVREILAS